MAAESRPGITGPWRLVSHFEIRLVICLLSKVTGLSLGNYVTASPVMGQRALADGHAHTLVGDQIPGKCNLDGFADIIIDWVRLF